VIYNNDGRIKYGSSDKPMDLHDTKQPLGYPIKPRELQKRFLCYAVIAFTLVCIIFGSTTAMAQKGSRELFSSQPQGALDTVSIDTLWPVAYARPGDKIVLAIVLNIKNEYHINADSRQIVSFDEFKPYPTRITVKEVSDDVTIESPRFPEAKPFKVEYASGYLMTFADQTIVYLPMRLAGQIKAKIVRLKLEVAYQACNDKICLFPEKITLDEKMPVTETGGVPAKINREYFSDYPSGDTGNLGGVRFDLFGWYFSFAVSSWTGLLILFLTAAFGGMLLNFTPCVLPLIPIKIICLANAAENRRRCLALGSTMFWGVLVFWLGLGGTIAMVSGFTATNQLFQYPVFTIAIGIIIAIMAFGMCGLFSVRLPRFVYMINPNHETLPGSFGLGILTAILSTPCTAPFMGAAAAWAATQHPATTLLTFAAIGTGMAAPYLILSASPALLEKMPGTGPVSVLVKQIMGMFMLAAAAYFIGSGLSAAFSSPPDPPNKLYWWVVMGVFAAGGAWLAYRVFHITTQRKLQICFAALGLIIMVGSGHGGMRLTGKGPIDWVHYTPDRFQQAIDDRKIVVTVFTAEWCLNCKALEQGVLNNRNVARVFAEEDIVPIKVDITGNNRVGKARLKEIGHLTIPLLVIYAPGGKEIFRGDFYTTGQILQAIELARAQSGTFNWPGVVNLSTYGCIAAGPSISMLMPTLFHDKANRNE
jgi:thiol:disulfide interchange protein DsbD